MLEKSTYPTDYEYYLQRTDAMEGCGGSREGRGGYEVRRYV
jgi:hypothetical protein